MDSTQRNPKNPEHPEESRRIPKNPEESRRIPKNPGNHILGRNLKDVFFHWWFTLLQPPPPTPPTPATPLPEPIKWITLLHRLSTAARRCQFNRIISNTLIQSNATATAPSHVARSPHSNRLQPMPRRYRRFHCTNRLASYLFIIYYNYFNILILFQRSIIIFLIFIIIYYYYLDILIFS